MNKLYFIGIEINNIGINIGLSNILQGQVEYISNKIWGLLCNQ